MPDAPRHVDLTTLDDSSFQLSRANAIHAYAYLEQALCRLFAFLAQVDNRTAGIVFFKVVNTRSRLAILDQLMRYRRGDEHRTFFNSLMKNLPKLDTDRNKVIHWLPVITIYDDRVSVLLQHPDFSDSTDNQSPIDEAELNVFARNCTAYGRAIHLFTSHLLGEEQVAPWQHIFQLRFPYPLPEDHPIFQIREAPATPPESSQA